MKYTIKENGDALEKEAFEFIQNRFPNYELVWQIYVGNKGNATIAELPNYPYNKKRENFAENSYTVLESSFIIDQLIKSEIFIKSISSFNDYLDFMKSFITFFACLGRLHDTVEKASNLLKYNNSNFIQSIKEYYSARNIILHEKKIPVIIDELGLIKIPTLSCWEDKNANWSDVRKMDVKYVQDSIEVFFNEMMSIINNEYAVFKDLIHKELKEFNTQLLFEYSLDVDSPYNRFIMQPSGTTFFSGSFDTNQAYKYLDEKT